ncbi:MAG: mercury methylation ferredoxin HgcB [bacterium]
MKLEYFKDISTIQITNTAKCMGCGTCIKVCPHNVFSMINAKAAITHKDACMECGACKKNCPVGIIEVREGVGCAAAIITGMIKKTAPQCGCSGNNKNTIGCG